MIYTIPGTLPGLNDYISAERGNKYAGASMKKRVQSMIVSQVGRLPFQEFDCPVFISYTWYEPNRRRDLDNVAFAKKFIQDALVEAGVLQGDGWKHVVGFEDRFSVDKDNPRIEIQITEVR